MPAAAQGFHTIIFSTPSLELDFNSQHSHNVSHRLCQHSHHPHLPLILFLHHVHSPQQGPQVLSCTRHRTRQCSASQLSPGRHQGPVRGKRGTAGAGKVAGRSQTEAALLQAAATGPSSGLDHVLLGRCWADCTVRIRRGGKGCGEQAGCGSWQVHLLQEDVGCETPGSRGRRTDAVTQYLHA